MTTIFVPAPPKSAFNKDRPVSDLLEHQLRHFQHIEAKLPTDLHSRMTARDLHTEAGAARYIAHITDALRLLGAHAQPPVVAATPPPRKAKTPGAPPGLAIAAAAAPASPTEAKPAKAKKRSAAPTRKQRRKKP